MRTKHTHCFVAGQSGGHILPCITLAQEIRTKSPNDTILFFTTCSTLDIQLTKALDTQYTIVRLPIHSIKSRKPLALGMFCFAVIMSFIKALYYLFIFRPQSITSSGSICSIPVAYAAYCMQIPIDLYELNVLPGKTTYFLTRIARTIYHCFDRTLDFLPKKKCTKVGYPIRFFHEEHYSRTTSHTMIGFDPHKKTILILGGSQGSTRINTTIKQWITQTNIAQHMQIIHQTGFHDQSDIASLYAQKNIHAIVFPFHNNMEQYYAAADLIICRSGAGTLFETLYFHTPCITIPLELQANAHQIHNAFTIAQEYPELFHVFTQDMLTNTHILENKITKLLTIKALPVSTQSTKSTAHVSYT